MPTKDHTTEERKEERKRGKSDAAIVCVTPV